jgi:ATP-dependent 26S proteasome regulatory subunit
LPPIVGEVKTEIAKQNQQKMLALNGSIQVPRDAETDIRKAKELRMNQRLEHLSNKGKKVFRRMANDFAKATMKEHERLSQADKVANFREEVRWSSKEPEIVGNQMSDEDLDKLIVDNWNKLDLIPNCLRDAIDESKIEHGSVTAIDFTKQQNYLS